MYLHPKALNGHSKALYAHPKALYKQKKGLHSSQVQPLNFTMKNYVNPVGLEEEIAVVNYLGLHVELTHEHGGCLKSLLLELLLNSLLVVLHALAL